MLGIQLFLSFSKPVSFNISVLPKLIPFCLLLVQINSFTKPFNKHLQISFHLQTLLVYMEGHGRKLIVYLRIPFFKDSPRSYWF